MRHGCCAHSGAASREAESSTTDTAKPNPASFRDPSGFVFVRDGTIYRQVNRSYAADWDRVTASGFLERLQARGWLLAHENDDLALALEPDLAYAVIRPSPVDFLSYPYEWCFGQLKAAAIRTLEIQQAAIAEGFSLRDASAYNIQFQGTQPILIDSLSFEVASADEPWVAYRQFCEQFLAPLALISYRDARLARLMRDFVDGMPLDLTSGLLPRRTWLRFGLLSHLHLHARAQRRFASPAEDKPPRRTRIGPTSRAALLDSLVRTVANLDWKPEGTEWAGYADNSGYGRTAERSKEHGVGQLLRACGSGIVWDLGSNTGRFSRIAADLDHRVVALDLDPAATERHYRTLRADGRTNCLPLVQDLMNPSPGIGWAGTERSSIFDRANADIVLALALVHHLAIARNVPLRLIAETFARIGPKLIIEFVPKEDPMVQRLLASRTDVFPNYSRDGFLAAFGSLYTLEEEFKIEDSARSIWRMTRR